MSENFTDPTQLQQTLRNVNFDYRRASDALMNEVINLIRLGEPLAILGPVASGKQQILEKIAQVELDAGAVVASVQCESFCDRPDEFFGRIASEIRRPYRGKSDVYFAGSWDLELEYVLRHDGKRVLLMLSNIDALPTQTARSVLKSLRRLKQLGDRSIGTLAVVFTGSYDLAPLVYGIESEFPISRQFVLQGFDEVWFDQFLHSYAHSAGYEISAAGCRRLYHETGGEILLLRLVIETLIDSRRARKVGLKSRDIEVEEVEEAICQIQSRFSVFSAAFYRAFSRVASSSNGLGILELLFERNRCDIPSSEGKFDFSNARRCNAPSEIELCGLARRDSDQLYWSSPLIQTLARHYFSSWTIGDCYACLGDWLSASSRYAASIRNRVPLALTLNQRPHLAVAIKTFAIELTRLATDQTQSIDDIRSFFCDYLRCLTGMENISIWRFEREWKQIPVASQLGYANLTELESLRMRSALIAPESMQIGQSAQNELGPLEVRFRLSPGVSAEAECIVAANYRSECTVSTSQREQFHFLCTQFSNAYHHRLEFEKQSRQAEIDRKLLAAIPNILQIIDRADHRSESALRATADNLRSTDLRRVMFSLVDEVPGRIKGVVDSRIPGEPDIAELTNYSLNVESGSDGNYKYEDVQQKCVLEKRALVIPSAADEPLINGRLRKDAQLKAFVLVPIQYEGRVLGTMHIERLDQKLPSGEYILAVESFCENLGKILHAMTWFDGLQQVATTAPDSVTLWDLDLKLQFANQRASNELQVKEGWQSDAKSISELMSNGTLDLVQLVQQGSAGEKRMFPEDKMIQEVRPIRDWRKVVFGFSVRTQSVRSQMQLMDAFREFSQCRTIDELADALLRRMKKAGHSWARIYKSLDANILLGWVQYGLPEGSPGQVEFDSRQVVLDRRSQGQAFWNAMLQKKATVYTYDPHRPNGCIFTTSTGLSVMNVKDCGVPASLAITGDVWIDLPLYCDRRSNALLGKVTVECMADLTRESLLDLEILSVAASEAWAVILDREDREVELAAERRQEMLRAMGETMHQLQSRIASLWTWIDRIKADTSATELVVSLTSRLNDIDETISNAKSKLRPLGCYPVSTDLYSLFAETLKAQLGEGHFRVCADPTRFLADVDVVLIKEVIDELVLNTRKAVRAEEKSPQVSITLAAFTRLGNPWARVEYQDNGPGIAPQLTELIFKEFYSSWPASDLDKSSGLGLSHLRTILSAHLGRIFVKPSEEGACFVMEFPRNLLEKLPRELSAPAQARGNQHETNK